MGAFLMADAILAVAPFVDIKERVEELRK